MFFYRNSMSKVQGQMLTNASTRRSVDSSACSNCNFQLETVVYPKPLIQPVLYITCSVESATDRLPKINLRCMSVLPSFSETSMFQVWLRKQNHRSWYYLQKLLYLFAETFWMMASITAMWSEVELVQIYLAACPTVSSSSARVRVGIDDENESFLQWRWTKPLRMIHHRGQWFARRSCTKG